MSRDPAGAAFGVSVSEQRSKQRSTSVESTTTQRGTNIQAGEIEITARETDINMTGAKLQARDISLDAKRNINLLAAENTAATAGNSSGRSLGGGVTFGFGSQNGFSIQVNAGSNQGKSIGNEVHYDNTLITATGNVKIKSGGDVNMRGAQVAGDAVKADIGGNLNIESLQDITNYVSQQSSGGVNVSLCIPPICYGAVATVGGSAAGAKADGVFISPNTQAGIKAGDGGFDVNVRGNTHLSGAVIESTQAAIDAGKNSFRTGGTLTMSELQNVSRSSGSSYAVSGGVSLGYTTAADATPSLDPKEGQRAVPPTGSAGVGSDSGGEQNSTTRSGISGIAGDQSVRTGNNASAGTLVKDWNTQTIVRDVQAQAQLTQQFNQSAAREIGTYADKKRDAALSRRDKEEAARWNEGGEYRVALHTAAGALSGGVAGALGAGASAALMPRIGDAIAEMGLPTPVAQALGAVTAAAIGAIAGGAAGAASAYSVDINNRQLHPTEIKWIKDNAKRFAQQQGISEAEAERRLSQQAYRQVQFGVEGAQDSDARSFLRNAGNQLLPADPSNPNAGPGYMFYATPEQRADATIYLASAAYNTDFYNRNGLEIPSRRHVENSALTDAQARYYVSLATKTAAGAAAAVAMVGLSPSVLTWALTNPEAAVMTGVVSAETATAIVTGAVTPGMVIGATAASGRANLINTTGRNDNCTACVTANIINKLENRTIDNLVTAAQVEARFGYTGASRGLSISDSLKYIENATGTTAVKTPMLAEGAPSGNYAVMMERISDGQGHVMYGHVLPNGKTYFWDPQVGGSIMSYEQLRRSYTSIKTYFMRPN